MQQQNSPKAIGGLVCGVVSLVLMFIGLFTAGIAGIIGLAVGIVGLVLSFYHGSEGNALHHGDSGSYRFYYRRVPVCNLWVGLLCLLLLCLERIRKCCKFFGPVGKCFGLIEHTELLTENLLCGNKPISSE